jgi:hypothetical protein
LGIAALPSWSLPWRPRPAGGRVARRAAAVRACGVCVRGAAAACAAAAARRAGAQARGVAPFSSSVAARGGGVRAFARAQHADGGARQLTRRRTRAAPRFPSAAGASKRRRCRAPRTASPRVAAPRLAAAACVQAGYAPCPRAPWRRRPASAAAAAAAHTRAPSLQAEQRRVRRSAGSVSAAIFQKRPESDRITTAQLEILRCAFCAAARRMRRGYALRVARRVRRASPLRSVSKQTDGRASTRLIAARASSAARCSARLSAAAHVYTLRRRAPASNARRRSARPPCAKVQTSNEHAYGYVGHKRQWSLRVFAWSPCGARAATPLSTQRCATARTHSTPPSDTGSTAAHDAPQEGRLRIHSRRDRPPPHSLAGAQRTQAGVGAHRQQCRKEGGRPLALSRLVANDASVEGVGAAVRPSRAAVPRPAPPRQAASCNVQLVPRRRVGERQRGERSSDARGFRARGCR